jgi:hypothetical protein
MAGGHEEIDWLQVAGMRLFLVFIFERDIAIEIQENIHGRMLQNSLLVACYPQAAPAPSSRVVHDLSHSLNHDSSIYPYCSKTVVKGALKTPFSYGLDTKMPSLISLLLLT